MKMYKSNDFAKQLGVTRDFLKYYEQHGVLKAVKKEGEFNKLYRFDQSPFVIECQKYRNLNHTAKEIQKMIYDSSLDDILSIHDRKEKEINTELDRLADLLYYFDNVRDYREKLGREEKWYISEAQDIYYLPHTKNRDFIKNAETNALIKEWMYWLPIVESTQKIMNKAKSVDYDNPIDYDNPDFSWGFSVDAKFAQRKKLSVDPPVEYIASHRCLEYYFQECYQENYINNEEKPGAEKVAVSLLPALEIVKEKNFEIVGDIYRLVLFYAGKKENRTAHGIIRIPIK